VGDVWGPFSLSNAMKRSSPAFSKKKNILQYNGNWMIKKPPKGMSPKEELMSTCIGRRSRGLLASGARSQPADPGSSPAFF